MRRTHHALPVIALSLLAACGGEVVDDDSGATASPPAGAPEPETEADDSEPTIRDVDFSTLRWRDAVSERFVRISPSDADPSSGPVVSVGELVAYADADGDGDEDALVPLSIADGNDVSQVWYVWTWDEDTQAAVQVENPIARESRCGDAVTAVAAAEAGGFVVTERLRSPEGAGTCSADPEIPAERTVVLSDGWPVLTTGLGGHGGICPQPGGTDAGVFPVEDAVLLGGPRESIGLVRGEEIFWFSVVDVSARPWLQREDWTLVHFGPLRGGADRSFRPYGDYTPCAWVNTPGSRPMG